MSCAAQCVDITSCVGRLLPHPVADVVGQEGAEGLRNGDVECLDDVALVPAPGEWVRL